MVLSAVIFDLNGTVLADEAQYGRAFAVVLKTLGIKVDSDYPHVGGIGVEENWPIFINKFKIKTEKTVEQLAQETQGQYLKLLPQVTLKSGFLDFVSELQESEVKIALATSNTWSIVEKVFDRFEIEDLFDCVTTAEEVLNKKPDSEVFVKTAEKLGVESSECVVIEDSKAGIDAAKDIGMKVIAIARDDDHKKTLKAADLVVRDFEGLTLESLKKI